MKQKFFFISISTGRPFALQNCSVSNQSIDTIHVECIEGFDGGLPQMFLLEMVEIPTLKLVRNLTLYVSTAHCCSSRPTTESDFELNFIHSTETASFIHFG